MVLYNHLIKLIPIPESLHHETIIHSLMFIGWMAVHSAIRLSVHKKTQIPESSDFTG